MYRLLKANLSRVINSKLFWALCVVMAGIAVAFITGNAAYNERSSVDGVVVNGFGMFTGIAVALFSSIFFGTEYGDGTIRNKLIVGHGRTAIFLTNLLTAVICAFGFAAAYFLPVVVIGFPVLGLPTVSSAKIIGVGSATLVAFCSVHTTVSMVYANKAGATVVNLLIAFVTLVAAYGICMMLYQPEFVHAFGLGDEVIELPNRYYVSGASRALLVMLVDVMPAGHVIQSMIDPVSPLWSLPLCSAGVCVACAAIGVVVFRGKNIK